MKRKLAEELAIDAMMESISRSCGDPSYYIRRGQAIPERLLPGRFLMNRMKSMSEKDLKRLQELKEEDFNNRIK